MAAAPTGGEPNGATCAFEGGERVERGLRHGVKTTVPKGRAGVARGHDGGNTAAAGARWCGADDARGEPEEGEAGKEEQATRSVAAGQCARGGSGGGEFDGDDRRLAAAIWRDSGVTKPPGDEGRRESVEPLAAHLQDTAARLGVPGGRDDGVTRTGGADGLAREEKGIAKKGGKGMAGRGRARERLGGVHQRPRHVTDDKGAGVLAVRGRRRHGRGEQGKEKTFRRGWAGGRGGLGGPRPERDLTVFSNLLFIQCTQYTKTIMVVLFDFQKGATSFNNTIALYQNGVKSWGPK